MNMVMQPNQVASLARAILVAVLDEHTYTLCTGASGTTWLIRGRERWAVPEEVMDYLIDNQMIELINKPETH